MATRRHSQSLCHRKFARDGVDFATGFGNSAAAQQGGSCRRQFLGVLQRHSQFWWRWQFHCFLDDLGHRFASTAESHIFFALDPIGRIWPKPVFIAAFSCVIGPWGRLRKRLSTCFWRIKMDATLDRFGREENLAWWNSITQSPVLAMLTSQAPIPKITGGRSKTWCSGLNFLCCMGSTTFLSTPSREPRMPSRKSWCPTWKLAWPQGSMSMCRSIHEIKVWICAVGISTGWFVIACVGPKAMPLGSSLPLTSTSTSTSTMAICFQMARFHKIIWEQVGMPSLDFTTKVLRKFTAFPSNDIILLVLRLARWRLLHRGVRRICRNGWGNRTPWRRCRNTSTTCIWRTTPGGIGSRTSTPKQSVLWWSQWVRT